MNTQRQSRTDLSNCCQRYLMSPCHNLITNSLFLFVKDRDFQYSEAGRKILLSIVPWVHWKWEPFADHFVDFLLTLFSTSGASTNTCRMPPQRWLLSCAARHLKFIIATRHLKQLFPLFPEQETIRPWFSAQVLTSSSGTSINMERWCFPHAQSSGL